MELSNINRIFVLITNADLAGAPIHVRDLVLALKNLEYNVHVAFGEYGPVKSLLDNMGIPTYVIPTLRSNISPFMDIKSIIALRALVKQVNPDIIHVHSSKAGFIGRIVAFILRIPVVYTVHGWGFGPGRRLYVAILVIISEWLCKRITTRYISVSEADRLIGIRYLRLPHSKITTIYNSTSLKSYITIPFRSQFDLIMVARNEYPKDYATFFKSLKLARFDRALVVGKGTNDPNFVLWARNLAGINAHKISFLGVRSDIDKLLDSSTVMVLSSEFEGLPISILEAMAKGLPIIASDVGGVSELVVHGTNGLLFRPRDVESLANHISYLFTHPGQRSLMAQNSLARIQSEFDFNQMVVRTIEQYRLSFLSKFNC